MSAGFLYVLINPTMPGLSKVGKTTRNPQDRAAELSAVTGVASPFILAYQQPVLNCDAAERWVHHMLTEKGKRHASNREFFNAPLHEILPLALQSADIPSDPPGPNGESGAADDGPHENVAEALFQEGCAYLHGDGAVLRDTRKAMEYFEQAAAYGHIRASIEAAFRYEHGKSIEGGPKKDVAKALSFLTRIAREGAWTAHADMANLFVRAKQPESAQQQWKIFFEGALSDRQACPLTGASLDSPARRDIAKHGWTYCDQVARGCIEPCVDRESLRAFSHEIRASINRYRTHVGENSGANSALLARLDDAYDLLPT